MPRQPETGEIDWDKVRKAKMEYCVRCEYYREWTGECSRYLLADRCRRFKRGTVK